MKVFLYPSLLFLRIASQLYAELHPYPELATVVSGTVASFLLGTFYLGIPLGLITRKLRLRNLNAKIWYFILLCGLSAILLGETSTSTLLLMISSSITVLATIFASAISTAKVVSRTKTNHRTLWTRVSKTRIDARNN